MTDWHRYREQWPYLANGTIWLQHAGVTPLCQRVIRAATEAMAAFSAEPGLSYPRLWSAANEGARAAVASFLTVSPDRIALVKNTSQGLIFVAESLPYQAGDTIVTLAGEYPANRLPWRAAARLGATVRVVQPDAEGRFPIDRVAAAIDASTRVVAVSWVQYLNGFRIDLPALAEVCARSGAYLVVDGVQGVGALPVPIAACDALAVGGHKWLCGAEGAGFLYLAPRLLERLQPFNVSWHSVADDLSIPGAEVDTEDGLPALKPTAERFEEGTPNCLGNLMLTEAVRMLGEIGPAAIESRLLGLLDHLLERLAGRGYLLGSSLRPGERSGIIALRHPEYSPADLLQRLRAAQIVAIQRGACVRLSPHFYNSPDDMDQVASVLP